MIEPEAGNRYGGTDWTSWDVVQIWQAIENQDTAASYELLTGWQRSYELVSQHLTQVQNYRENLAAAWPPAKSPAAAAYIERLDTLIAHLTGTYNAAVTNYQVLSAATSAIAQARTGVQAIHHEYASNQAKIEEYRTAKQTFAGRYVLPKAQPPVPDGRQEELNYRARTIMFGLSNELIQARTAIVKPAPFSPDTARGAAGHERNGESGSSQLDSPNLRSASRSSFSPGISSSVEPAAAASVGVSIHRPDLTLSGVTSPAIDGKAIVSPRSGASPSVASGPLQNIISPLTNIRSPISQPDGSKLRAELRKGILDGRSPISLRPVESTSTAPRFTPVDGIIGGTPSSSQRGPSADARSTRRINPIGGVISASNPVSRASDGNHSVASPTQTGNVARGPLRPANERDCKASLQDHDSQWEAPNGVSPIVSPSIERPVNPGPAIGLR